MARKAETVEAGAAPPFSCAILADRGGVGKTATAALIWATLAELGQEVRLGEVEGATERKLSALMENADAGSPDPNVTTPSRAECTADPKAIVRAFAPALAALAEPTKATIIDNGATVSRDFLDAAEMSGHADEIDGGRHLRIVVVAKAEDLQSGVSAEASLRRARAIYPNARIVLVVTHVVVSAQGQHNAGPVIAAVEAGGKASAVVLVPLLNNPYLGELYGERHVPFHVLAELPLANVAALLGDADTWGVRMYRGQFLTWYNKALASLAAALELPAPPARSGKSNVPLETASVAAE